MAIDFACSGACGLVVSGATVAANGNARHWEFGQGVEISTSITRSPNPRSIRIPPATGTSAYVRRGSTTGTDFVGRVYFCIDAWPTVTMNVTYANVAAGAAAAIQIDASTHEIEIQIGGDVNAVSRPGALSLDTWYYVEFHFFCGTNGFAKMTFNGEATEYQSDTTQTATTFSTGLRFGTAANDTTFDCYLTDILMSETPADYGTLGAGYTRYLVPASSGAHSFTLGDFGDTTGTNIAVADTTVVHGLIDDAGDGTATGVSGITDFVQQKVSNVAGYVQFGFTTDAQTGATARAVMVVSALHSSTTGANTCTLKWWDGSTETAIYTNADFSQTTLCTDVRTYATHPTAGAFTKTVLDAVQMRWGYSNDVVGVPFLDGVVLEVEYAGTPGGGGPGGTEVVLLGGL